MRKNIPSILSENQLIDDKYTINFFLKKGNYAESYRVKDANGKTKFLKLFAYAQLHRTQYDNEGNILEIELLKQVRHPNILSYVDSGILVENGQRYAYLISDYISGETIADRMRREEYLNPYITKDIILDVLKGLDYLHNLPQPVVHNELTNLNIMLDLSGKTINAKIIDFGYARYLSQSNKDFLLEGLNPFYLAPETLNKVCSIQSDIFSVGVLYYHLLFGLPPWFKEISSYKSNQIQLIDEVGKERKKALHFFEYDGVVDEPTRNIISKALQLDANKRFQTAKEFIQVLQGEVQLEKVVVGGEEENNNINIEKLDGQGFDAIAGMENLKNTIQIDVIDALNQKEKYAEYGLTIPNGMLLYGPPGCGKTFFAERMAEEIGFNFFQIKPSDIQSKWVNASQENIKALFDKARKEAPSIIFIDELDALVPNRDNAKVNHMNTSAVNEFLAQMNNSGSDGVFVIGATNRPNAIDPAILRAGRLDKIIYLPPPDFAARKAMFRLNLKNRPIELGLNYEDLAKATENYVSSDIKFLCDEAARKALKQNGRISMKILIETINANQPSVKAAELDNYNKIREQLEGNTTSSPTQRKIGFN